MSGRFKKSIAYMSIILTVVMIFLFNVSSESNIVDSMNFQGEGTRYTFEKALETAVSNNASIILAQKNLEQAQVNYKKEKSKLDELKKRIEDLDNTTLPSSVFVQVPNYKRDVTLPMLQLDFSVESAQRDLDGTIAGVKASIEQVYFSVLHAAAQCEIQKENLDISKAMYESLQKKYSMGLISKQELLNGEMNLVNSEVSYRSALNALAKTKMSLNNILGNELMQEVIIEDELTKREFELESIAQAIGQAFTQRSEIKALEHLYKMEALNLEIIGIQYPENTYIHQEQKLKVEKALQNLENAKKAIELEVRSNYIDIIQKQEEIVAGEKSVEIATEAFMLTEKSYDAGISLMLDVQRAQLSLLQSKLNLSRAIVDYNLAVSKFYDSIDVGRK